MFVNRVPFLTSFSRHLKFTTAETLHNRTNSQMFQCVTNLKSLYKKRGFNVTMSLMDGEFVPMRTALLKMGVLLNTASASEHILEIERQHRVIKERARACRHYLPLKMIPKIMITEMIYNCVLWINTFPPKGGVSASIRPPTLLTGVKFDYNCHCKLAFGGLCPGPQRKFAGKQSASSDDGCHLSRPIRKFTRRLQIYEPPNRKEINSLQVDGIASTPRSH